MLRMKLLGILKIFFVAVLLATVTSFVLAQDTVDQVDQLNRDLEEIKKGLLKDTGDDVSEDVDANEETLTGKPPMEEDANDL